ncbi:MAG: hypothetical protein QQN63_11830, partial [Nitrosopumilus sp.]
MVYESNSNAESAYDFTMFDPVKSFADERSELVLVGFNGEEIAGSEFFYPLGENLWFSFVASFDHEATRQELGDLFYEFCDFDLLQWVITLFEKNDIDSDFPVAATIDAYKEMASLGHNLARNFLRLGMKVKDTPLVNRML